MTKSPLVRSYSLRCYVLRINKIRKANNKKPLSIERIAKKLIDSKGADLQNEIIEL